MVVAGAESAEHDFFAISPPVPIEIGHVPELGAFADVSGGAAVGKSSEIDFEPGGNHQPFREHRGAVGFPIAIGVLENPDFIVRLLRRLYLRISERADDPEPSAVIPP